MQLINNSSHLVFTCLCGCRKNFTYITSYNPCNNSTTWLYYYLQRKKWKPQEANTKLVIARRCKLRVPWGHVITLLPILLAIKISEELGIVLFLFFYYKIVSLYKLYIVHAWLLFWITHAILELSQSVESWIHEILLCF